MSGSNKKRPGIAIHEHDWAREIQIAVLGNKGTGKTRLVEKLAEIITEDKTVMVLDTVGAIHEHARNKEFKADDWVFIIVRKEISEKDKWVKTLKKAIKSGKIICITFYLSTKELVNTIESLADVLLRIKNYALIIDEAQEVLPQLGKISFNLEKLIRVGRNFGIKPIIITSQRPQTINKKILALSDIFVIKKIDYYADADVIAYQIGIPTKNKKKFRRMIKNLKVDEFYFIRGNQVYKGKYDLSKDQVYLIYGGRPPNWFTEGD